MKTTLKNRINLSLEILSNSDSQHCMDSNDKLFVYYASRILGSRLSKHYNNILMNRNAVPNRWDSDPIFSGYKINSAFKDACTKVVEYIERRYNITPGRLFKLLDIILSSYDQPEYSKRFRKKMIDGEILHRYLQNLNDLRMHYGEMTKSETYDFSFDMVYDFIDKLSQSNDTLALSFLIMYWLQRENKLIPLAVSCDKNVFTSMVDIQSGDTHTEREIKQRFRLFMHKLLNLHLKAFIQNESKDSTVKKTSRDRVIELIKTNPNHTAKTMASCLELSVQAVQKQIAILKKEKRLKRNGPDKGGKWEVIEK